MKKIILVFGIMTTILVLIIILSTNIFNKPQKLGNGKIQIVATLFPQYDFVSKIGKEKVDVKLLLPSGAESHEYEPTPKDYMNINNSDIFIYTGSQMEPWAEKISSSMEGKSIILDVSKNIEYIKEEHNDHGESLEHEEEHEHEYDPHIWLDIENACIMVDNITKCLANVDKDNSEYYINNAEDYKKELRKLDKEINETVQNAKRNKMVFGGTFSYAYFVNRYGLEYISAYESCTDEVEPSVSKIKEVISYINKNDINTVFYPELSNGKVANMIAKETDAEILVFNSIHNVSEEEIEEGVSYINLMEQNLKNLKIALN